MTTYHTAGDDSKDKIHKFRHVPKYLQDKHSERLYEEHEEESSKKTRRPSASPCSSEEVESHSHAIDER